MGLLDNVPSTSRRRILSGNSWNLQTTASTQRSAPSKLIKTTSSAASVRPTATGPYNCGISLPSKQRSPSTSSKHRASTHPNQPTTNSMATNTIGIDIQWRHHERAPSYTLTPTPGRRGAHEVWTHGITAPFFTITDAVCFMCRRPGLTDCTFF